LAKINFSYRKQFIQKVSRLAYGFGLIAGRRIFRGKFQIRCFYVLPVNNDIGWQKLPAGRRALGAKNIAPGLCNQSKFEKGRQSLQKHNRFRLGLIRMLMQHL
jgi:hypothetical protein